MGIAQPTPILNSFSFPKFVRTGSTTEVNNSITAPLALSSKPILFDEYPYPFWVVSSFKCNGIVSSHMMYVIASNPYLVKGGKRGGNGVV